MLKSSSQKNYSSFTLIEVVFAVGIILIFLGSLIAIFNVGTKNAVVSKHRLQAANLARGALEIAREVRDTAKVQGVNWNQICWLPNGDNYPLANCNNSGHLGLKSGSEEVQYDGVNFKRKITVINTSLDIKKITATVSWDDYGQSHSVTMVTYLTNY